MRPTTSRTPLAPKLRANAIEAAMIRAIVQRAKKLAPPEWSIDTLDLELDITACHLNGCKLKLTELLAAAGADFGHDVFGIRKHIDRTSGQLTDHFRPRFAAQQ
jgi:hypothetical protein